MPYEPGKLARALMHLMICSREGFGICTTMLLYGLYRRTLKKVYGPKALSLLGVTILKKKSGPDLPFNEKQFQQVIKGPGIRHG